jgi:Raf kinase inhibitor-like YbhB/YbcL family protein
MTEKDRMLAIERNETDAPGMLGVASPGIRDGRFGSIHSAYGENMSPPVKWRGAPADARSFVLMIEDADAPNPPFVHWIAYNISGEIHALAPNAAAAPGSDIGQGANSAGREGYFGMRPPHGPAHHYHLEVFALDSMLDLPDGADRERVLDAMRGHVLAKGEIVGEFQRPA